MSQRPKQPFPGQWPNAPWTDMPQQVPPEDEWPTERIPKQPMPPVQTPNTPPLLSQQIPLQPPIWQPPRWQGPDPQQPPIWQPPRWQGPDPQQRPAGPNPPQPNMPTQGGMPPQQRPIPAQPQRRFGFLALLLVGAIALTVGAALGALGNGLVATTAVPAKTSTATATATKTVTEQEPTATASSTKTQEPRAKKTTAKPEPTKTAEPTEAVRPTKREWAKVVKNPDAYSGKRFIIYGQVTQFDSATGSDTFRADTAHRDTTDYGYFDGANTILTGDQDELSDLVQDDVFRASVTVIGSFGYDTQMGGNTTVPHLTVNNLKVVGNNG